MNILHIAVFPVSQLGAFQTLETGAEFAVVIAAPEPVFLQTAQAQAGVIAALQVKIETTAKESDLPSMWLRPRDYV